MDAGDWNLSGAVTMRKSYVIYAVTVGLYCINLNYGLLRLEIKL